VIKIGLLFSADTANVLSDDTGLQVFLRKKYKFLLDWRRRLLIVLFSIFYRIFDEELLLIHFRGPIKW